MVKQLVLVWAAVAVAVAVAAAVVPSVELDGGIASVLGVAVLFGLVNALIGPLLRLITLPLSAMTFGLFAVVVNAVLLAITAGLSDSLDVGGFLGVVVATLVISVVSGLVVLLGARLMPGTTHAPA